MLLLFVCTQSAETYSDRDICEFYPDNSRESAVLRAKLDLRSTWSLDGVRGLLAINYRKPTRCAGKPLQWDPGMSDTARRMLLCHRATWPASGLCTHKHFQVWLSNCGPPFFLCPRPVSFSISITFCGCYSTTGDIFRLMQNGCAVAW